MVGGGNILSTFPTLLISYFDVIHDMIIILDFILVINEEEIGNTTLPISGNDYLLRLWTGKDFNNFTDDKSNNDKHDPCLDTFNNRTEI